MLILFFIYFIFYNKKNKSEYCWKYWINKQYDKSSRTVKILIITIHSDYIWQSILTFPSCFLRGTMCSCMYTRQHCNKTWACSVSYRCSHWQKTGRRNNLKHALVAPSQCHCTMQPGIFMHFSVSGLKLKMAVLKYIYFHKYF